MYMSRAMRNPVFGVSDTNWAVKPQRRVRGLKYRIYNVEGLYYLYFESEDADQLPGYSAADLRKKPSFLWRALYVYLCFQI